MLKFREEKGGGHFASSAQPRNPRPPHVEFRVGQVIKHKLWGYHGVIIGWDETAKYAVKTTIHRFAFFEEMLLQIRIPFFLGLRKIG